MIGNKTAHPESNRMAVNSRAEMEVSFRAILHRTEFAANAIKVKKQRIIVEVFIIKAQKAKYSGHY